MTKKLLIVEEALRDLKAHWFQYILTISESAKKLGWEVDVACNKDADPEITKSFSSFPIFKHARYLENSKSKLPGEKFYRFILHSLKVLRALWPFLKNQKAYDHIFAPTVLVHHLLAWYFIMLLHPNKPTKLTLFFVTNPGVWNPQKGRSFLPKSTIILKKLLQLFSSKIQEGKVQLAVETEGAKKEFEELTGLSFVLLPHPVPFDNKSLKFKGPSIRNFSCFGFARHEKGSDLLKSAIEEFLATKKQSDIQFAVQWTDAFKMPDGNLCNPGDVLLESPAVTVIDRPVMAEEYKKLLSETSCMLLPYRNSSYHARVSRIAIESVCMGIPVIYTKGGWLEETIKQYGAGIGIKDESKEELVEALTEMEQKLDELSEKAIKQAEKAIQYYSPENFCKLMLN